MKSKLLTCLFAAFFAAGYAVHAEVPDKMEGFPLIFSEDFEEGHDNWVMTEPAAWKLIEDGEKKALSLTRDSKYQPKVRSRRSIAEIKGLNVSDFIMDVRVKSTSREYGHRDVCFFFNKVDESHFYYVHIATEADPHAHSVFLVNNEPRVSIALDRTDGVKWDDEYHHVRIKRFAASGAIEVYFNDMDEPIMIAEDSTFTTGTLGVGSFDDPADFDYVRIWGNLVEGETPPKADGE